MIRYIFVLTLLASNTNLFAQKYPELAVSLIKDDLKLHADVVVRKYDLSYTVINEQKAIKSATIIKTILNSHGKREALFSVPYDDFRKIKKFDALILDQNGVKIDKIKNSEIIDYNSGGSSIDDTREKIVDLSRSTYPFTIMVEYEVEFSTNFYSPSFAPQDANRLSVESASFTLSFPDAYPVRYKAMNLGEPTKVGDSFFWEIKNVVAIEDKPYFPNVFDFLPVVLTSPNSFVIDKSAGNFKSWSEFGKWYYELNKGRDHVDQSDKDAVKTLVANISSDVDKVRAVYHYMQGKTRYVSVQLGIGGYQTMPAQKVSEDGWGDCKALTNYTKALLQSINITAYPALVNSGFGANKIIEDFPSNQFDHVILSVPMGKDTIWLECTSTQMPFNFLGDFTESRKALLITPSGGELVKTPTYIYKDNLQSQNVEVWFDKLGQGKASVSTAYYGLQFDNVIGLLDESEDKLKKISYKKIGIPNFTIDKIGFEHQKDQMSATRNMELSLRDYATKSGPRIFFKPNLMNRRNSYPKPDIDRAFNVEVKYGYTDIDTIQYHFPEGYYFEYVPKNIHLESQFGTYDASFEKTENGFLYIRKIERFKGTYPKESFNDMVDFLKNVKKADNTKVVLTSST